MGVGERSAHTSYCIIVDGVGGWRTTLVDMGLGAVLVVMAGGAQRSWTWGGSPGGQAGGQGAGRTMFL